MSDYDLYYWSVPFRGQFVRAVLTFAGKTRTEADDASISQLMSEPVKRMPVPFNIQISMPTLSRSLENIPATAEIITEDNATGLMSMSNSRGRRGRRHGA